MRTVTYLTALILVFASCDVAEGPQGPQGPPGFDGQNGADGRDGNPGADSPCAERDALEITALDGLSDALLAHWPSDPITVGLSSEHPIQVSVVANDLEVEIDELSLILTPLRAGRYAATVLATDGCTTTTAPLHFEAVEAEASLQVVHAQPALSSLSLIGELDGAGLSLDFGEISDRRRIAARPTTLSFSTDHGELTASSLPLLPGDYTLVLHDGGGESASALLVDDRAPGPEGAVSLGAFHAYSEAPLVDVFDGEGELLFEGLELGSASDSPVEVAAEELTLGIDALGDGEVDLELDLDLTGLDGASMRTILVADPEGEPPARALLQRLD